jgi:hypothetical protein
MTSVIAASAHAAPVLTAATRRRSGRPGVSPSERSSDST